MNDRTHSCDVAGVSGAGADSRSAEDRVDPEQRGSLLGFVAHEMRNPLSTALWSAELMARLSPEDRAGQRGEKLSGMCLRSLQRLRLLVEDHFLAERLAVGGMPLRREPVGLRGAVDAAREKVGAARLQVDVGGELTAWTDRALLDRALEGLLAVATRGGVEATVSGWTSGRAVGVRVAGAPAAPDALDPPRKGSASDPTGRALALHMARRVASALGGSLALVGDDYLLTLPTGPVGESDPDGR